MAVTTYEEEVLTEEQVGAAKDFLPENTVVKILFHKGKPSGFSLPQSLPSNRISKSEMSRGRLEREAMNLTNVIIISHGG